VPIADMPSLPVVADCLAMSAVTSVLSVALIRAD
jgi:hypothetical protein